MFLFAVFPILINTYQGVRECDKNMLEVARSFRSSEWRVWRDVLLPFAVPYIVAGVRLAIGRGLIGMIIAEFYTTISGLGFMITRYANNFEMDKTFVPVIVLMFLGVSLTPPEMAGAPHRALEPRQPLNEIAQKPYCHWRGCADGGAMGAVPTATRRCYGLRRRRPVCGSRPARHAAAVCGDGALTFPPRNI